MLLPFLDSGLFSALEGVCITVSVETSLLPTDDG
jgi:hypothetical protein